MLCPNAKQFLEVVSELLSTDVVQQYIDSAVCNVFEDRCS